MRDLMPKLNLCSATTLVRMAGCFALALACPAVTRAAETEIGMRKVPPTPAAEALKTFELHRGLKLEQVAAEPLVASPVAAAFDENGRLYVAEMLDYPESQNKSVGRVRILVDTDGDGRFDRSEIFADGLPFPSGLACFNGGVFVGSTPDLLFLKDTDGDLRADERRVVFTGFGNAVNFVPARVFNGFPWGLDNRFYGVSSRNAGVVKRPGGGDESWDLRGKDFSFDPRTLALRPESGSAQFGVTFDDFGRRFVCSNSNHLILVMYDYRYGARNPFYDLPRPLLDIPVDGPAARVFRLSPEESWRVMRTQWRMAGKAKGPTEGGHTSGYFTSASGVTIYRGDALPEEFRGNAFVGEPANNLVHRKRLRPEGVGLAAFRPDEEKETEFLRSRDTWFRPISFVNGPDGALYILDMYRELIEEPLSIPPDIVRHYATGEGSDRGRIYRVVPEGFHQPPLPKLTAASSVELVRHLENTNGWYRDTAARLIYERQDRSCADALARLVQSSKDPVAQIRALYALDGIGELNAMHLMTALGSGHAEVREHAACLAERFLGPEAGKPAPEGERAALRRRLLALATDPADRVRYQLAFTIGSLTPGGDATEALCRVLERDVANKWISAAVLSSLGNNVGDFFARVTSTDTLALGDPGRAFLAQMLTIVGARARPGEMALAVRFLASLADAKIRLTLVTEFQAGLKRGGISLAQADPDGRLAATVEAAAQIARDAAQPLARRVSAIQLLAAERTATADKSLFELLRPAEPQKIQIEAIAALGERAGNPAEELVKRWRGFTPRVREEAIKILVARPDRARTLLAALRKGELGPADLSAGQTQALVHHPDAEVRQEAAQVFARAAGDRAKVIDEYRAALALRPDAVRGKTIFANACASCHRLERVGFELGPDLRGVRSHGRESILIDVLDPNRKLDSAYTFYQIETSGAQTLLGTVADETPTSITVKQAFGNQTVVSRGGIVKMQSLGRSMMPDGLENAIGSPQAMADLLEYIVQVE